jgi:hypothetical protein
MRIEIMRNTAGQLADGLKFLCVTQFIFGLAPQLRLSL